jgi:RimJ/RimL family protein N-acetyltransferase
MLFLIYKRVVNTTVKMIVVLNLKDQRDVERLCKFSKNDLPDTFTYFRTRDFTAALDSHILTLLYVIEARDVGYAHIIYDSPSGFDCLGICILPEFQRRRIGTEMLEFVLNHHKNDLYLSVFKENLAAQRLYEKMGFRNIETIDKGYVYKYIYTADLSIVNTISS